MRSNKQGLRAGTQVGFFVLFCVAPLFNLFRFDLDEGHFYLLGFHWSIGIGEALSNGQLALNLLLYGLLPVVFFLGLGFYLFYRFGRIYCGWLCPHFSLVETFNRLMLKASAKMSVWLKQGLTQAQLEQMGIKQNPVWWLALVPLAVIMGFTWALVLLTYIINPQEVYWQLWNFQLSFAKQTFLIAATLVLSLEFLLARHLFCRYGCAFGLFQSLAWMANRRGLRIRFDKSRASQCRDCDNDCDHACPMQLKPRGIKRHMFSCTQCNQCVTACENSQGKTRPILSWQSGLVEDENAVAIPIGFYPKAIADRKTESKPRVQKVRQA